MSNDIPNPSEQDTHPVNRPGSGLGSAFREARESLGMDIEEAARKLCLSTRQLLALEADDVLALPSPAFTRGFIRNYAKLLNLEVDPLLAVYRDMLPDRGGDAAISLPSEGIPIRTTDRKTWLPYLAASVLIGIAGGLWMAYMEWSVRQSPAPVEAAIAPVEKSKPVQATPPAPSPVAQEVPVAPVSPSDASVALNPVGQQSPAMPPAPTTGNQPNMTLPLAVAKAHLSIRFTQESWVRVLDRDGVEILSKTRPVGSEEMAEGQPPFKVDVGNAAGVQLIYNGQPVDLAPHTRANVARLTLE